MSGLAYYLPFIWAFIVILAISIYVILDGFDLGIGMLFAFEKKPDHRDVMINTIAPVWDGNETWMVLGGATLFGVFPGAYSTLLPAFYIPIIIMLGALIFRGVAFEFRIMAHSPGYRTFWNKGFMAGSMLASFCQGCILGGYVQGIHTHDGAFAGGPMDWLTPFSVLCGLSVIIGYALLGTTWLVWRTSDELEAQCRRWSKRLSILMLLCIIAVSCWTPFLHAPYLHHWLAFPNILFGLPVPLLVALFGFMMWHSLDKDHTITPFLCTIGWFLLSLVGLAITIWPYAVPPTLTLWDVASPVPSQLFQLVGTVILLPIITGYSIYSYYLFRGKVTKADGYH